MTVQRLHTEIERLLDTLDGDLTSHSRVIDALLDVRGASNDEHVVRMADEALRTVPGKNAAETSWLRNQLETIGLMAELSEAVATPSTAV